MNLLRLSLVLPLLACAPDSEAKAERPAVVDAKLTHMLWVADSLQGVVRDLRGSADAMPETTRHVVPVHRVTAKVSGLGLRSWSDIWMWWVRGDHTFLVRTAAWRLDSLDTCDRGCIKLPTSAVLLTEHYRDTVILRIK